MATREEILEKARAAKKAKAKEMVVKQVAIPPSVSREPPSLGSALGAAASKMSDIRPIPLDMPEDYDFGQPDPNWRPPTRMDQLKGMADYAGSIDTGVGEAAGDVMGGLRQMLEQAPGADQIKGMMPNMEGLQNQMPSMDQMQDLVPNMDQIQGAAGGIRDFLGKGVDAVGGAVSKGMDMLPQRIQDPNSMMNMQRQRMMEMEKERQRQEEEFRARLQKANMMQQQRGGRTVA
jgi:hypothetical protein